MQFPCSYPQFNCKIMLLGGRSWLFRRFSTELKASISNSPQVKSPPVVNPLTCFGFVRKFGGAFPPLQSIALPRTLFDVPARLDLIHRVICWFRAGERVGLASSKGRGQVAGSNRKIHAQKGSGRARAGDAAAPHRRGGNN
jgi:large subunit ribosomal protein L4